MAEKPDIRSEEWLAEARGELVTKPCPRCHRYGVLELDWKLVSKPIGTFSLAGQTMKTSARWCLVMTCSDTGCPFAATLTEVEQ